MDTKRKILYPLNLIVSFLLFYFSERIASFLPEFIIFSQRLWMIEIIGVSILLIMIQIADFYRYEPEEKKDKKLTASLGFGLHLLLLSMGYSMITLIF